MMNIEAPPVKAVSKTGPRCKVRVSKQCQNGQGAKRRIHPEGTPLQQAATWPGKPKDPPVEVDEMEVEDANPSWSARERTLVEKME